MQHNNMAAAISPTLGKLSFVLLVSLCGGPLLAANHETLPEDLTELSLDALLEIQVTSVSKRKERLSQAAAAAFVLKGEEIRASGVQTLVEALRLIPGIMVARVDAHSWAVTARGVNSTLADKLEVQMDGRTLYTPLFSGIFWETQDTLLEDIDRIEVVRGPGGALWGANAVNGVINIVTKSATETQGTSLTVSGGNETRYQASARNGGTIGDNGHYRFYAKSSSYDGYKRANGGDPQDGWDLSQAGFRTDWALNDRDQLTVQGDLYDGDIELKGETMSGFNFLANWQRALSEDSNLSLKFYYDHVERDIPTTFAEDRDQYDLELTHSFQLTPRQQIVWGGGIRRQQDQITNVPGSGLSFIPDSATLDTYNLYVQDQISITDSFTVTLGSKFENNDFTGNEVQPSARFSWVIDDDRTLWGAISRAVRIPNRLDHGFDIPGFIMRSTEFESEEVVAYELGYRWRVSPTVSLDIAGFYNDFDQLRGVNSSSLPGIIDNEGEGRVYGLEASAQWVPRTDLRFLFAYTYLDVDLNPKSGSTDTSIDNNDGIDPEHQAFIRGTWDINNHWSASGMLRYVDELNTLNTGRVPSYTELNTALHWQALENLEISLIGENLLHDSHLEFGGPAGVAIERNLQLRLNWRF